MIKRITPLAILAATLLAPPLWAADGTMTFSGKLKENACELDAGSKKQTLDLGRRSTAHIGALGGQGGSFTIQLNNCPASSNQVRIRFEGEKALSTGYNADKLFALSNAGQTDAASNAGFIISDNFDFSSLVSVNGVSKTYDLQTGAGTINKLPFTVGYYTLEPGAIMPGTAIANIQFSVEYP
ncbi:MULTISPECIES: fimbrial protein [unclassified Serratia (in: enterobacteria)]|uniref:fimbrial protein n=1 Tax=unclassified Serratia (in: enterobacteria) TaxID=2647522 RepID=UPI003075F921